jgi:hypothetical protein
MWKWSDLKRIFMRKASGMDIADLGAVMWPVSYPNMGDPAYQPKDPHVTIVIFKDINNPDLGFTREDVVEAVRATEFYGMLWLRNGEIEWFGAEQDVPVLRVEHDFLYTYRDALIKELDRRGIPIDMTFPDYKPHITITDEAALDNVVPRGVLAGPVEVWWGEQHYKLVER